MKTSPIALVALLASVAGAAAHDGPADAFAAGTPGAGSDTARVVDLTITEKPDGRMSFGADDLRAARGDEVRFVVRNDGRAPHEFRLDTAAGNAAHKAMMAQMPSMVHHDANAVSIAPGRTATLVWRFSKPGIYEFACLLPGHYEAGMHGGIVVAK